MEKAGAEAEGAVLASDAFFPFSWNDGVELACRSGVKAIAHPGGSIRDQVGGCSIQLNMLAAHTCVSKSICASAHVCARVVRV